MFQQRLMDRPVVPVSYLSPLSAYNTSESREIIGVTPVCITMEPESTLMADFVRDIDYGTRKRRRSPGIQK